MFKRFPDFKGLGGIEVKIDIFGHFEFLNSENVLNTTLLVRESALIVFPGCSFTITVISQ